MPSFDFDRILGKVFLAVLGLALGWGVLELALNQYLLHAASEGVFNRYASQAQHHQRRAGSDGATPRLQPHHYLGYVLTPGLDDGVNRHNARGFRGEEVAVPKPEGTFRIVCIGSSTTYSTGVADYRLAYPHLLADTLRAAGHARVEVVNAGVPGWTSWESLSNLHLRLLDLEPDLVIVYHGFNDLLARLVWPPEAYAGDNGGYLAPPAAAPPHPWYAHSTLLRLAGIRLGLLPPADRLQGTLLHHADTFVDVGLSANDGRRATGPLGPGESTDQAVRRMLRANAPTYFHRNLRHLALLAQAHGARVVFATFALAPPASSGKYRPLPAALLDGVAEHNAVVEDVARATGASLFDFAAVFPDDPTLFADPLHVTARGAQLKAHLFARFLLREGLLPPAPGPLPAASHRRPPQP